MLPLLPGPQSLWMDTFPKHEFEVDGSAVTVICPRQPREGNFWAWKGEFLDAFPAVELALLREGLYVVYLSAPDTFGCPATVAQWDAFYSLLTNQYHFAAKPALIGLSRGGLYCYQWAIQNPQRVACLYGDAPVCDMRSWPGGKGKGCGSPDDWAKVFSVFGFTSDDQAMTFTGNPIDNLAPLAKHHVPILHVYGDADDVVPWDENTGVLAERYKQLGGEIQLIGKPGVGHHPHGLPDPKPIVDFILAHTAKAS